MRAVPAGARAGFTAVLVFAWTAGFITLFCATALVSLETLSGGKRMS